jgi:para-aminobenzoate synthetase component I
MLNWANRFSIFCFLDNAGYEGTQQQYECLLAAGAQQAVHAGIHALAAVDTLIAEKGWVFGHLSYEAQHQLFGLQPKEDKIGFPLFYFFKPQVVVTLKGLQLTVEGANAEAVAQSILSTPPLPQKPLKSLLIQPRLSKEAYIKTIEALQQHIHRGDCYEINFCQEFFAEGATVEPALLFQKLVATSPNPFAAFYRVHDQYLICASPERFLAKKGSKLVSQPIKGTAPRGASQKEDERFKNDLLQSQKERAENVMVVDLVRNDLSKISKEGSVQVEELFGIYSFPRVHQMISTISSELEEGISFSKIIEATFPMGSMTGAPKLRVMQLIDQYEPDGRGIFSGAVGYIAPNGDFDFNVVIRSIMYNAATQYLAYKTGSGITFYSQAAQEWEECQWKGAAIKKVLTS